MNNQAEVVVKNLGERLGPSELALLRQEMQQVLQAEQPRVVLDLSTLRYMDSPAIDTLIHCLSAVVRADGELKLAALSPQAAAILAITRVDRFFEIFPTVEDAVKSFDFVPAADEASEPWNNFARVMDSSGSHSSIDMSQH
ncbi:MAG TPA: STAS domain-containing protein [Terriglobales bacterium]|jgi:anti-anti-sigma factor